MQSRGYDGFGGQRSGEGVDGVRVVVVGGTNTDIAGFANGPLVARDSNPGHARISSGGVGRNIAENLALLGASAHEVHLITAFGDDHNARELAERCRAAGVDVAASVTVPDMPGSVYLAIMDEHGDMALALSDMRPLDALTPAAFDLPIRRELLASADLVVVDANIPAETLVWLAGNVSAPLVLDAVSVAKAPRALGVLSDVRALKASGLEAGVLLGREVRNRDEAEEAARDLVALGVSGAFVTAGAFGVAWADAGGSGRLPAPDVPEVVNATGAGDAFAAGMAHAILEGMPVRAVAAFGSACAAIALESEATVNPRMSAEWAISRMEEMLT
jgi:pseudouridine kinase